jgi:hypothetical protein
VTISESAMFRQFVLEWAVAGSWAWHGVDGRDGARGLLGGRSEPLALGCEGCWRWGSLREPGAGQDAEAGSHLPVISGIWAGDRMFDRMRQLGHAGRDRCFPRVHLAGAVAVAHRLRGDCALTTRSPPLAGTAGMPEWWDVRSSSTDELFVLSEPDRSTAPSSWFVNAIEERSSSTFGAMKRGPRTNRRNQVSPGRDRGSRFCEGIQSKGQGGWGGG